MMAMPPSAFFQAGEGSGEKHSPSGGLLNYQWNDQLLQLELDEMNLSQLRQGGPASNAQTVPDSLYLEEAGNEEEDRRKRSREAIERDSLEHFLKDLGRDQEQASGGSGQHGETTRQQAQSDEKGKRSAAHTDPSTAAKTKAGRERARRERLNESFAELSKVLEPGKAAKTDKSSIITDAIRIVTQLRAENGQLRQLNKFLEERVGTVEKQKNDLVMQQAMLQQQGEPSHLMQGNMMGTPYGPGGVAMGQPVQGIPAQGMHVPQMGGLNAMGFMQTDLNGASNSGAGMGLPAARHTSSALPDYSSMPSGSGLAPGMPMRMSWLPPATMDTSQDSVRRPPAA
ncbi:g5921 [Coccomyxa viridis]|uniref:G5921 protein n=1 Tax=Coccomyxa viridis TaxID=1274662 RepID=A0ABP1FWF0_9CHLO